MTYLERENGRQDRVIFTVHHNRNTSKHIVNACQFFIRAKFIFPLLIYQLHLGVYIKIRQNFYKHKLVALFKNLLY